MEAVYDDLSAPMGLGRVTGRTPARGGLFGIRGRSGLPGTAPTPVVSEGELYAGR